MNQSKLDKILGTAKSYENSVKDSDGDKLMNIIDCQPYNKHKQGIFHDIAAKFGSGKVKEWGKEGQVAAQQKYYAEKKIRANSRAAYYWEKEQQEVRAAKEKAKIEADRKISSYKQRPQGFFSALVSQTAKATTSPKAKVIYRKATTKKQRKMMRRATPSRQVMPTARQPMRTDFTSGNIFVK